MPAPDRRDSSQASSPLAAALARVGDRWSLLVVEALLDGPRRFNDLLEALPGMAPNILAARLRRMEREALVVARPYSQRPPRSDYTLTAAGRDLASVLRLLADWGERREPSAAGRADTPRHEACGTPVEVRWYCPTCDVVVAEDQTTETRSI